MYTNCLDKSQANKHDELSMASSQSIQIETQHHEHDARAQCCPGEIEYPDLPILPGTKGAKRYPDNPHEGEHQYHAGDSGEQGSRRHAGPGLEGGALCGRHRDRSPAIITAQRRKGAWFNPGGIDVFLNTCPHTRQVLAQPVITETDPGIRIRLGFRGANQGFERMEFMDEASECFALCVHISKNR